MVLMWRRPTALRRSAIVRVTRDVQLFLGFDVISLFPLRQGQHMCLWRDMVSEPPRVAHTKRPLLPSLFPVKETSKQRRHDSEPLWRGTGSIHGFVLGGKSYQQGWATAQAPNYVHRFWCEESNVDLTHMQPHYYRVRQVEPCHKLG